MEAIDLNQQLEAQLSPLRQGFGRAVFALGAATEVEKRFHMGFCLKALDALRKNPTPL